MKNILISLFFLTVLCGCASMNPVGSQNVMVKSVPPEASVRVSNGAVGQTPFVFRASRKEGCTVIVSKPGFRPLVVGVTSSPSTFGLKPNPVLVRLSPFASGQPSVLLSEDSPIDEAVPVVKKEMRTPVSPSRKVTPAKSQPVQRRVNAQGTEFL